MNLLLAEGFNLGLRKRAAATNTHSFWELLRSARWHVEGSAYDRALAMIVEAHAALPMAAFWGQGQSASSDGQFFLATEQGEAMNLINAKYGNVRSEEHTYALQSLMRIPYAVFCLHTHTKE